MVIISAQVVAVFALPKRELARLLIFVLAASMAALLAFSLAAFLVSLMELLAQVDRAVLAASQFSVL